MTSLTLYYDVTRYFAMDRDRRYERVKVAYDMLVKGEGENCLEEELPQVPRHFDGLVTS